MKKILVAYFSATGTTGRVAQALAESCKGDLFEIIPEKPYTAADLNWNDKMSRSSKEMADPASRPAVAKKIGEIAAYDPIFLGFPIWWYQAPRIIETFLTQYDFSGKTIIPFATSGGSGLGDTVNILKKICPDAKWLPGKRFNATVSVAELGEWVKKTLEEVA